MQCLKLGPPSNSQGWSEALLQELQLLIAAAPQLLALELSGAGDLVRASLENTWTRVSEQRGHQASVVEVRPGVLRLAAGPAISVALPIELPPRGHTLPAPMTPEQHQGAGAAERLADQNEPAMLDDLGLGDLTSTAAQGGSMHAAAAPAVVAVLPPRCPGGDRGGHSGARVGAQRQANADTRADGQGAGAPPRQRKRKAGVSGGDRSARAYRGGRAEDELPDGGINLASDDDGE